MSKDILFDYEQGPQWLSDGVDQLWDLMPHIGDGWGLTDVLPAAVELRAQEIGGRAAMQELVDLGNQYGKGNVDLISTFPRVYMDGYDVVDSDDFLLRFREVGKKGLPERIIDPRSLRSAPQPFAIQMPGAESFYLPEQGGVLHTVSHKVSPFAGATGATAIWGASRRFGREFEDVSQDLAKIADEEYAPMGGDQLQRLMPAVINRVLNSGRFNVYGPESGNHLTWSSMTPDRDALLGVDAGSLYGKPAIRGFVESLARGTDPIPDPLSNEYLQAAEEAMAASTGEGVVPLHIMGVLLGHKAAAVPAGITRDQIDNGHYLMNRNNYFVAAPRELYN